VRACAGPGGVAGQPVLPDREPAPLEREVRPAVGAPIPRVRAEAPAPAGRSRGAAHRGQLPKPWA
jgi:hypothetical protein